MLVLLLALVVLCYSYHHSRSGFDLWVFTDLLPGRAEFGAPVQDSGAVYRFS